MKRNFSGLPTTTTSAAQDLRFITGNNSTIQNLNRRAIIRVLWPLKPNDFQSDYQNIATYHPNTQTLTQAQTTNATLAASAVTTPPATMLNAFRNHPTIAPAVQPSLSANKIQELMTQDIIYMHEINSLRLQGKTEEDFKELLETRESLRDLILKKENQKIILSGKGLKGTIVSQWQELNISQRQLFPEQQRSPASKRVKHQI